MYYLIKETLEPCSLEALTGAEYPYAAVLTPEEWRQQRDSFTMGIDMDSGVTPPRLTRAIVNYDSLTGSIYIPQPGYDESVEGSFAFALDEKGVVFIDESGLAARLTETIAHTKKWRMPSLERFLYDFLELIIQDDLGRLENLEHTLEGMEQEILSDASEGTFDRLNDIRGELLDLHLHYGQLIDMGQELWENENGFFREENLRFFRMFTERAGRLRDTVYSLREYTVQLRDLIQARIDVKQNRIMTLLTVITTIFTPLTLLTGWYGMNFKYMPELEYRISYPIVILVSLAIALGCIAWFKKKKWL